MTWDEFVSSGDGRPLSFEQLPFNHPLYILYSSGTSGPPKCIVHSAGVNNFTMDTMLVMTVFLGCITSKQERLWGWLWFCA